MANTPQNTVVVVPPQNNIPQQVFQGVAASAQCTVNVPIGATYYGMQILFSGATSAQIASGVVRVLWVIDGETIIDCSAADLQTVYQAEGGTLTAGVLNIPIVPQYFRSWVSTEVMGVGLGQSANSYLQVTFGSTITGITGATLYTQAVPDNRPLGAHRRLLTQPQSVTAAGDWSLDLQRPGGAVLKNLYICNAASATQMSLRVNNSYVRNAIPTAVMADTFNREGYVAQADTLAQSFDEFQTGVGGLAMDGCTDLNLTTTVSEAPTGNLLRIVQEYAWNYAAYNRSVPNAA